MKDTLQNKDYRKIENNRFKMRYAAYSNRCRAFEETAENKEFKE